MEKSPLICSSWSKSICCRWYKCNADDSAQRKQPPAILSGNLLAASVKLYGPFDEHTCSACHFLVHRPPDGSVVVVDGPSSRTLLKIMPVIPYPFILHCSSSPSISTSPLRSCSVSTSTRRRNRKSDIYKLPPHRRPQQPSRLSTISFHYPSIPA